MTSIAESFLASSPRAHPALPPELPAGIPIVERIGARQCLLYRAAPGEAEAQRRGAGWYFQAVSHDSSWLDPDPSGPYPTLREAMEAAGEELDGDLLEDADEE